jgi:hypothetical protein
LFELFEPFTKSEQKQYTRIAVTMSKLPEVTSEGLVDVMRSVIDSRSDVAVRGLIEEIEASDENVQPRMWQLVHEFGLIDARRLLTIIDARLGTIRKLKDLIDEGAKEVPDIHVTVRQHPWLFDPRWHLLDDEVDMTKLGVRFEPEQDEDGNVLDFMFGLVPHTPAGLDEIIIVEIKRGTFSDGSVRSADEAEVNKFHQYVLSAREHAAVGNSSVPRVRGLMIAQRYTGNADRVRHSLETVTDPQMVFKTWHRVIDETERMHEGWLEVSGLRSLDQDSHGLGLTEAEPTTPGPRPPRGS